MRQTEYTAQRGISQDERLHTLANPFCYNPKCPCHTDSTLLRQVERFIIQGLMTDKEATLFIAGKML